MGAMRDVKRRIRSVHSTQQITKAMNLVAAAKLQKARMKLEDTKPFFNETKRVISNIVSSGVNKSHPFLKAEAEEGVAVIVVTSDRGLCGGYNANVNKEAFNLIKDRRDEKILVVGNKARDFFRIKEKNVVKNYTGISEDPIYEDATEIGKLVLDMYSNGEVSEVYVVYTEFRSTISHVPKVTRILPVDTSEFTSENEKTGLMSYEPSEEAVLSFLIPRYINTVIYGGLVESAACEQGSRMTSMDSATKNSSSMIDNLTLIYNRARQGAITQEITEIVSGANALE